MSWAYTLPVPRPDDREITEALLWGAGATGVWERRDDVVGYFEDATPDVPTGGTWEEVAPQDWLTAWRAGIEPVAAGPFDIVPTWLADAHPEGPERIRLVLDPGRAFGSGHHDTTAGCLEVLAGADLAGRRVLDVGCGTGVLAIAAARLGAAEVLAVDVDADAIEVTDANAAANGVALTARAGSIDVAGGGWDVVVANLLTHTILELAPALAGALAPAGLLVLSGIGWERAPSVLARLAEVGLAETDVRQRGEWAVITASPHPPHVRPA